MGIDIRSQFQTDAEYGYQVSLNDDRDFPIGHRLGFSPTDTEVSALQKIMDTYLDVSDPSNMEVFTQYKLEFSIMVLDTICISLIRKIQVLQDEYTELEVQEEDISHLMTKPYLTGQTIPIDRKMEIYQMHEEIIIRRRNLKDSMTVMKVFLENMEKTRNFILGMNRRHYSAKSDRFRNDQAFQIGPKFQQETRSENTRPATTAAVSITS